MRMIVSTNVFPLPRVHRSSFAADERSVRGLGAQIFAKLLPLTTAQLKAVRPAPRPRPSPSGTGRVPLRGGSIPQLHSSAMPGVKGINTMQAYRTESNYYFSSRQILVAGTLVFFSEKIRRYVHPTAGILFDPHPRLRALSGAESQELAGQWQEALARY
jgi:hypothetical protein